MRSVLGRAATCLCFLLLSTRAEAIPFQLLTPHLVRFNPAEFNGTLDIPLWFSVPGGLDLPRPDVLSIASFIPYDPVSDSELRVWGVSASLQLLVAPTGNGLRPGDVLSDGRQTLQPGQTAVSAEESGYQMRLHIEGFTPTSNNNTPANGVFGMNAIRYTFALGQDYVGKSSITILFDPAFQGVTIEDMPNADTSLLGSLYDPTMAGTLTYTPVSQVPELSSFSLLLCGSLWGGLYFLRKPQRTN